MPIVNRVVRAAMLIVALGVPMASLHAQTAPSPQRGAASAPSAIPADPWPRQVNLSNATVLMYQPQVSSWVGNRIEFRAALAIHPKGAKQESFGVLFASARTQVDKVARTVVFEDMAITKSDFPTLPDRGAAYTATLQEAVARDVRTISLDRLTASLDLDGVKLPTVPVQNTPPRVVVSNSPAILVPIDGTPVLKAVPGHSRFQRVINTHALILQGGLGDNYYLHVYDGWLSSASITGPWTVAGATPSRT